MKRIFSTILVAAMALGSITVYAQTDAKCDGAKECKKEKCEKKCDKKGDKKCHKGERKECNPFAGLQLTEQQQAALKAIPCPREVMKQAKQDCKADKKACENTNKAQVCKDIKKNYLNQVKAVLTPEQYVQFLENTYMNQAPGKNGKRPGHMDAGHKHKGGKFDGQKAGCKNHANCDKK
ncbi:MAG: hypothetical protein K2M94_01545 [Paramuribaculum sp.]|nr:hypothetical protein [Paramuribaculum sp.]